MARTSKDAARAPTLRLSTGVGRGAEGGGAIGARGAAGEGAAPTEGGGGMAPGAGAIPAEGGGGMAPGAGGGGGAMGVAATGLASFSFGG
jgi:hypothetical protein